MKTTKEKNLAIEQEKKSGIHARIVEIEKQLTVLEAVELDGDIAKIEKTLPRNKVKVNFYRHLKTNSKKSMQRLKPFRMKSTPKIIRKIMTAKKKLSTNMQKKSIKKLSQVLRQSLKPLILHYQNAKYTLILMVEVVVSVYRPLPMVKSFSLN
jgi:hypothetical protein